MLHQHRPDLVFLDFQYFLVYLVRLDCQYRLLVLVRLVRLDCQCRLLVLVYLHCLGCLDNL